MTLSPENILLIGSILLFTQLIYYLQFPNLMHDLRIDCIEIIFKYFEAVVENLLQFLTYED